MKIKPGHAFLALAGISVAIVLALVYLSIGDGARLPEPGSPAGLVALFVVGLFTGFHCVGMCGGFCAASAKTREGVAVYLAAKTASYALIGVALGALGSVVAISNEARAALAVFAGVFMVVYALNVFGVGFARKMYGMIPRLPVGGEKGGPVLAGFLNGFMPCGPLQAMQVYALSTANPVQGGLAMLAFALGTLPLMAGFGFIAASLSSSNKVSVFKASAVLVLVLGVMLALNGVSTFTPLFQTGLPAASAYPPAGAVVQPTPTIHTSPSPAGGEGVQTVRNELYASGYRPAQITVKAGKPVKWVIDVKELTGCNNAIKIPSLGIQQSLHYGENVIELPAMQPGIVQYSCWMGMLRGKIIVE